MPPPVSAALALERQLRFAWPGLVPAQYERADPERRSLAAEFLAKDQANPSKFAWIGLGYSAELRLFTGPYKKVKKYWSLSPCRLASRETWFPSKLGKVRLTSDFRNEPYAPEASPAALQLQAFNQIAAVKVLPGML
jgi:hypothetical protein